MKNTLLVELETIRDAFSSDFGRFASIGLQDLSKDVLVIEVHFEVDRVVD